MNDPVRRIFHGFTVITETAHGIVADLGDIHMCFVKLLMKCIDGVYTIQ